MRKNLAVCSIAITAVLGLSACNSGKAKFDPANADSYFAALKSEKTVVKSAEAVDIKALAAVFPDTLAVSYASSDFDAGSGATVISDIVVTAADNPDFGLSVKELSLWGVDTGAISDRIAGKNLETTFGAAKRIEATDLSLFGLETVFAPLMDATNKMTEDMIEGMTPGSDIPMPKQEMGQYDAKMAKVILTDITLHPWVLNLTPLAESFASKSSSGERESLQTFWHLFQKSAAWNSALSFGNVAIYDTEYSMAFSQDDVDMNMDMKMPLLGYKDFDRGDLAYGYYRDMSYKMDMMMPSTYGASSSGKPVAMEGVYELYSLENLKLARAMDHVARGVMPARTDTDFMGLGKFRGKNVQFTIGGEALYSAENFYMDFSEFHWLIPELIDMQFDNLVYNIAGFKGFIEESMGVGSSFSEDLETFNQAIEILEKYDLGAPSLDFNFTAKWDANSGDSGLVYGFGIDDFMRFNTDAKAVMPDYDSVMKILPENLEDTDEAALEALFDKTARLNAYTFDIVDEGGLEKSFALAKDFAELAPDGAPQAAFLRSSSPEQLRTMASSSLMIAAPQVAQAFPPAVDYLQSLSNFIAKGGAFKVAVKPGKPMNAAEFEALEDVLKTDPSKLVDAIGLTVVHTPPK